MVDFFAWDETDYLPYLGIYVDILYDILLLAFFSSQDDTSVREFTTFFSHSKRFLYTGWTGDGSITMFDIEEYILVWVIYKLSHRGLRTARDQYDPELRKLHCEIGCILQSPWENRELAITVSFTVSWRRPTALSKQQNMSSWRIMAVMENHDSFGWVAIYDELSYRGCVKLLLTTRYTLIPCLLTLPGSPLLSYATSFSEPTYLPLTSLGGRSGAMSRFSLIKPAATRRHPMDISYRATSSQSTRMDMPWTAIISPKRKMKGKRKSGSERPSAKDYLLLGLEANISASWSQSTQVSIRKQKQENKQEKGKSEIATRLWWNVDLRWASTTEQVLANEGFACFRVIHVDVSNLSHSPPTQLRCC